MAYRKGVVARSTSSTPSSSFPIQQLFILAICRICEPIAFMSIFPYIYYMIESFKITTSDTQIAVYAGLVTSSFAFAEFLTGVLWGRLSDRIGRKPVLIGGLMGTAISMIIFGFARNLPMALVARALGGLLNGNIAVIQTTIAELTTNKEHQPRAYSVMPFVWGLGSIIGPALGGALAQPSIHYPGLFSAGGLFDNYPFLLPNLVCTIILFCGVVNGILFLKETHPDKKDRSDYGLRLGQKVRQIFKLSTGQAQVEPASSPYLLHGKNAEAGLYVFEKEMSSQETPPPAYRTAESTPRSSQAMDRKSEMSVRTGERRAKKAFTRQIILIIITYGLLAYHAISFDQLMPVFLSSPVSHDAISLPFRFTGGFALSTKTIGIMLSIQALYSMACQMFLFPIVVKKLGALNTLRCTIVIWPLLYAIVPYLVLLPDKLQMPGAMLCLLWRITAQTMSFPSINLLLANSAPSTLVLGLINGVAASTASLSRALGPTISGMLHAWGLSHGFNGLAFWAAGLVCTIGACESMFIRESSTQAELASGPPEEDDEEIALTGAPALDAALSAVSKSSDNLLALATNVE